MTEPSDVEPPDVEPVETPHRDVEPVETPHRDVEPVETPAPDVEPVETPPPDVEPVETPAPDVEPVETPAPDVEPVETPAPDVEPVETPPPDVEPVETSEPVTATRAFWQRLGLPGLFDVHVHVLPPTLERAVWAVFDDSGPKIGRPWPIRYRMDAAARVQLLRSLGVRRFPTLPYAHKPGVARWLNDWSRTFAAEHPEVLCSATFFPEPDVEQVVAGALDGGARVFKVHVQVGDFDLADPALDVAWGLLAERGVPTVIHAGHAPVGNRHTGPGALAAVLQRHPRLPVIVAHLGAPDYLAFCDLADRYERVFLDTTMVFTDFWSAEYPPELLDRLRDLQPKVLLGTDVPTIPYPYLHQLEALARLDLGDDWLRDVCWHNGARLWGERG